MLFYFRIDLGKFISVCFLLEVVVLRLIRVSLDLVVLRDIYAQGPVRKSVEVLMVLLFFPGENKLKYAGQFFISGA